MANYVQEGRIINYANTGEKAIAYGDVVVLTEIIGVATMNIPAGATGTVEITGVYEMSAETTSAFSTGQTVYWVDDKLTTTQPETGAVVGGRVIEPKAQASAVALVKLVG